RIVGIALLVAATGLSLSATPAYVSFKYTPLFTDDDILGIVPTYVEEFADPIPFFTKVVVSGYMDFSIPNSALQSATVEFTYLPNSPIPFPPNVVHMTFMPNGTIPTGSGYIPPPDGATQGDLIRLALGNGNDFFIDTWFPLGFNGNGSAYPILD